MIRIGGECAASAVSREAAVAILKIYSASSHTSSARDHRAVDTVRFEHRALNVQAGDDRKDDTACVGHGRRRQTELDILGRHVLRDEGEGVDVYRAAQKPNVKGDDDQAVPVKKVVL